MTAAHITVYYWVRQSARAQRDAMTQAPSGQHRRAFYAWKMPDVSQMSYSKALATIQTEAVRTDSLYRWCRWERVDRSANRMALLSAAALAFQLWMVGLSLHANASPWLPAAFAAQSVLGCVYYGAMSNANTEPEALP